MQKPTIQAALAAIVPAPQVTIDSLRALSFDDLIGQLKISAVRQSSTHIGIGKMLVVLDQTRDEETDKTLKGYVRKTVGEEIEPASYKCAKAFALVGDGHGTILESQYDNAALNWLLTTSAILGFLEKHDEETGVRVREAVAQLLRAPNEKTGKALKAIKDSLKPEPEEGATDGEKEGDGDLASVDFTNAEDLRRVIKAIAAAIAKMEPEALAITYKGSVALSDLAAEKMTPELYAEVTAEMEKLAAEVAAPAEVEAAA